MTRRNPDPPAPRGVPARPRALAAAALAAALAGTARGDEFKPPAKKPYDHYRVIETRNIFSPPAPPAPPAAPVKVSASAPAAAAPPPSTPVLTGIVYNARTGAYQGLIETPGQARARFVGAGDAVGHARVLRVELDALVIQVGGKEVAVPVGGPLTRAAAAPAGGAPAGEKPAEPGPAEGAAAPADSSELESILERMRQRTGRPSR